MGTEAESAEFRKRSLLTLKAISGELLVSVDAFAPGAEGPAADNPDWESTLEALTKDSKRLAGKLRAEAAAFQVIADQDLLRTLRRSLDSLGKIAMHLDAGGAPGKAPHTVGEVRHWVATVQADVKARLPK